MFHFKSFQREDYARAALHDGIVLAHDTGGGKTIALFTWPILKVGMQSSQLGTNSSQGGRYTAMRSNSLSPAAPVLFVVPGDGHEQTRDEGRLHFNAEVTLLDSQATFLRLSTINPQLSTRQLPPGYYLTSYTQLTGNGVAEFPTLADCLAAPLDNHPLHITPEDVEQTFAGRTLRYAREYTLLQVAEDDDAAALKAAWLKARKLNTADCVRRMLDAAYEKLLAVCAPTMDDLTDAQLEALRRTTVGELHTRYAANIGETHDYVTRDGGEWTVKCVYDASLADHCSDSFECVMVDEGTKMKGEATAIGRGVRQMQPRYRGVLSATPIKNRLPDVFWLIWWAAGGRRFGHARLPYDGTAEAQEEFAREFMVLESNLSKAARDGKRSTKLTPQVMNIHLLWKLLAPVVLRRRKKEFGEAIVPKHRHVVRVPMGVHQSKAYAFHLAADYRDKNGLPAVGAKLQALRVCAANPASALLTRPDGDVKTQGSPSSRYDYVPKLASALNLLRDLLAQREQVLVFSAFHDSLDTLSARLREAGVAHLVCDGRMTQKQRGKAAKEFKAKKFPVLLASVESMAELHSFPQCSHVMLIAYSWAYDKFEQGINRVHRLNSPKDVHVWSVLCDGSIDGRLEGNIHEKADSAELVLDGQLLGEQPSEVNLYELLRIAQAEFNRGKVTMLDEAKLETEWPAVRAGLALAARDWRLPAEECRMQNAECKIPVMFPVSIDTMPGVTTGTEFDDLPLFAL